MCNFVRSRKVDIYPCGILFCLNIFNLFNLHWYYYYIKIKKKWFKNNQINTNYTNLFLILFLLIINSSFFTFLTYFRLVLIWCKMVSGKNWPFVQNWPSVQKFNSFKFDSLFKIVLCNFVPLCYFMPLCKFIFVQNYLRAILSLYILDPAPYFITFNRVRARIFISFSLTETQKAWH